MGPPHLHEFDQMAQVYSVCTLVLLVKYTFSQFYGVVPEEHPAEDVWYFFFPPIRAVEEVPPDRKRRHVSYHSPVPSALINIFIFICISG